MTGAGGEPVAGLGQSVAINGGSGFECLGNPAGVLASGLGKIRSPTSTASHRIGRRLDAVSGIESPVDQFGADRSGQSDLAIDFGGDDQCDGLSLAAKQVGKVAQSIPVDSFGPVSHDVDPVDDFGVVDQSIGGSGDGLPTVRSELFLNLFEIVLQALDSGKKFFGRRLERG